MECDAVEDGEPRGPRLEREVGLQEAERAVAEDQVLPEVDAPSRGQMQPGVRRDVEAERPRRDEAARPREGEDEAAEGPRRGQQGAGSLGVHAPSMPQSARAPWRQAAHILARCSPRPPASRTPRRDPPPLPDPAACQWCGRPARRRRERLAGRAVCARCGVASTDPPPTDAELDRAYGELVPARRRALRRAARRGPAPFAGGAGAADRRGRAARAGPRRGRRGRHPRRRARAPAAATRSGSSASPARRGSARPSWPIWRARTRRSSSGTRWSTCATPAPSSSAPRSCWRRAG